MVTCLPEVSISKESLPRIVTPKLLLPSFKAVVTKSSKVRIGAVKLLVKVALSEAGITVKVVKLRIFCGAMAVISKLPLRVKSVVLI